MFAKTSCFVALALLVAAALCGSASAAHGRHLTTCPYSKQHDCAVHCDPHSNCPYKCPCEDYHCNPHTAECEPKCPKGPKPPVPEEPDTCEGLVEKNGVNFVKVCVPGTPGNDASTNCGVGCLENCIKACEDYGELKEEYKEGVPRSFCNNYPGGNCKDSGLLGPCCGCNIDEACSSPPEP